MPRKLPDLKNNVAVLPPIESKILSRIPCLLACVGPVGSGKTHIALSIIKLCRREKTMTKLYIMCPSYSSNSIYQSIVKDTDWVHESANGTWAALKEVEADCLANAETYANDMRYTIAYKRFTSGETVSASDEHLLETRGYKEIKVTRPSPCLLLDDLTYSEIFSSSKKNPLTNLCLRHRHIGQGCGLSIILIAQNHKGIPKPMRLNLSHLVVFHTESKKEQESFYSETTQQIPFATFKEILEFDSRKKYGYTFIDNITRTITDSI